MFDIKKNRYCYPGRFTRAMETKNKLDNFYQYGSCPAKGKYALVDGINLSFTTKTSTHTPNSNQLTSENKLIQKILKFNLLIHVTQSDLILNVIVLLIGFKTEQDYDHEQE